MNARQLLEDARAKAKARIDAGGPRLLSPATVVNAAGDEATVYLYDAIDSFWGIDAGEFVKALSEITAKTIHLRINSPGGATADAEAIQVALQQHPAKVISHIDGMAASAATYIALSADEVEIADGGLFMIHNAWGVAVGNKSEMLYFADLLGKIDANILRDYQSKTGASTEQIKQWMDNETWFTAQEALTNGFVDRIYGNEDAPADSAAASAKKGDEDTSDPHKKPTKNSAEDQAAIAAHMRRERELALIEAGI
jgi:ATP-dependent protease ClpP protease subunit